MEVLENKPNDQECHISSIDQYSRRNDIEIQGITKTVKDEELESKIIDIFSALNISISSKDAGDSLSWKRWQKHYCKICKQLTLLRSTKEEDGPEKKCIFMVAFQPDGKLYLSENLTPSNQYLIWDGNAESSKGLV